MKCHPIRRTTDMGEDYSHNRDYIGKYWNRKYIRAIQAVLNSTKGKIGKGTSFFRKAFGENIEEYHKLLEIPETMIIYRYFFEWLGLENGGKKMTIENLRKWFNMQCVNTFMVESLLWLQKMYHPKNGKWHWILFTETILANHTYRKPLHWYIIGYYVNYRQAIIEPNTDLYKLKQVYNQNPLKELKRNQKIKGK